MKNINFEFYNRWRYFPTTGFHLFTVSELSPSFAFENCISIVLFNFEVRVFFAKAKLTNPSVKENK